MADEKYVVSSGFSLSGGSLGGSIAVKSFSGLQMDVEVTPTIAGNQNGGQKILETSPGPTKPGQPSFVCPIPIGDKKLATWWKNRNPNTMIGKSEKEDLIFTLYGEGGKKAAEWQLKKSYPMSYQVGDVDSNSSELAVETIQLCVTEIERME
jgi:phage tail-like protein